MIADWKSNQFCLLNLRSAIINLQFLHMNRSNLLRRITLFLAAGAWLFLLFSVGSFHPTDWPSPAISPHPPTANLCGPVGAVLAYGLFYVIGHGVFPILFFTGVWLILTIADVQISDKWMRGIGLFLLSVAFAAMVHHVQPGTDVSLPEGQGGVLGIGADAYLRSHMHATGTRLVLLTTMLVGLVLVADDLLLKLPAYLKKAAAEARNHAATLQSAMPQLAGGVPSLIDAAKKSPIARLVKPDDDEEREPSILLKLRKWTQGKDQTVHLDYENDEPAHAATEPAHVDASDPVPAAPAVIPPPQPASAVPVVAPTQVRQTPLVVNRPTPAVNAPNPVSVAPAPVSEPNVEVGFVDPVGVVPDASITDVTPDGSSMPTDVIDGAMPKQRSEIIVKLPNSLKPRQVSPPQPPKELGEYNLPGWECLAEAEHGYAESQEAFVREKAAVLEQALKEFNVDAHVVEIDTGPVITMYELSLAPGLKVSAITSLTNDIMRSLKAESVRIVAPVPGKNTVGIEVPNEQKEKVRFKELLQLAPDALAKNFVMPLFLGKDASGEPLITDLTKMPHCLIAGTTGSGKSVCINTIIMSIMYLQRPDRVKLILVDPKVVEMAPFKDIPHLMCPVINDSGRAQSVLEWACTKMDERYEFLAEAGVRNIKDFNTMTQEELIERFKPSTPEEEAKIPKHLPYIVIIIDELADLMMTSSGKETEQSIVRIAQKARAVGIHLILATQRPTANVVTGLIKSNMPTRISFRVQSRMDSRVVMDQNGAELLLGQGDMLFMPPGASKPIRSQGTFIDDKEIRDSVKMVRGLAEAQYEPELVQIKAIVNADGEMEKDELFDDAVRVVLETKRGSVSLLQRRLTIGYARASRLIEQMAATGIVGDYKGSQAREAMLTLEEWDAMKAQQAVDAESGMTV
jgi:DNA segregation ATPase FtsK/SpoIIIE-like protein